MRVKPSQKINRDHLFDNGYANKCANGVKLYCQNTCSIQSLHSLNESEWDAMNDLCMARTCASVSGRNRLNPWLFVSVIKKQLFFFCMTSIFISIDDDLGCNKLIRLRLFLLPFLSQVKLWIKTKVRKKKVYHYTRITIKLISNRIAKSIFELQPQINL